MSDVTLKELSYRLRESLKKDLEHIEDLIQQRSWLLSWNRLGRGTSLGLCVACGRDGEELSACLGGGDGGGH